MTGAIGKAWESLKPWSTVYWEMIDQLYWTPKFIGMSSIAIDKLKKNDGYISVPIKEILDPKSRLYQRSRKVGQFKEYMLRQEEPFNQIFSLTFSILAAELNAKFFSELLNKHLPPLYLLPRNLNVRYGLAKQETNITKADAFLASTILQDGAVLGIENKFNSTSSLDQLAKYLFLMLKEETRSCQQLDLNLLYIFNRNPIAALTKIFGKPVSEINVDQLLESGTNKYVYKCLRDNAQWVASALTRINVIAIDWNTLAGKLELFVERLPASAEVQTTRNLLMGLLNAIKKHPLSNVECGDGKFEVMSTEEVNSLKGKIWPNMAESFRNFAMKLSDTALRNEILKAINNNDEKRAMELLPVHK